MKSLSLGRPFSIGIITTIFRHFMSNKNPKPNRAQVRFAGVLDEISSQTNRLRNFNLEFVTVPAMMNLGRFKSWAILPKGFVVEVTRLCGKAQNALVLRKMGIKSAKELMQQEWLHRF